MRNDSLFTRAIENYNSAAFLYRVIGNDELQLNFIAYHLQQAVEMCIKFQLEQNGLEYPLIHNIEQLLQIAAENNIDLDAPEYIEDKAEMLSIWESHTRYVMSYLVDKRKVENAFCPIRNFLDNTARNYFLEAENLQPLPTANNLEL